jgi:cytochrome c-type biogenesis protein
MFFGHADPRDPVMLGAAAIQQTVAGWLDGIGVWPLLAALAVLVIASVLLGKRLTRSARGRT